MSKKCTSTTRVPYSLHFPLLSFTKQRGWTPKSKPRIFSSTQFRRHDASAPRRPITAALGARAEARIEAHALFARRPALSRCGGLSPVSGARGVGWTGRHPTSPPTAPLMLSSHPASPSLRQRHCAPAPCASERSGPGAHAAVRWILGQSPALPKPSCVRAPNPRESMRQEQLYAPALLDILLLFGPWPLPLY
eukprot:COSAG01_NODE_2241_length_8086_cov_25.173282_3_plen_193_part_00